MRSRSRSTTSRVATDCTRPAERRGMTFFQSTGETSNPYSRSRMRRVSCASTRRSSMSRVSSRARRIASRVISWKTMRRTGTFGFSTSEVPCNRLALAVFVRREQEHVRVAELLPEVGHDALLVGVDDVVRVELVVDVHPELAVALALLLRNVARAVRQVADVADARLHDVIAAQVAGDRPRLGGGFDDDEAGHWPNRVTTASRAASRAGERILRADGAPAESQLALLARRGAQLAGADGRLPAPGDRAGARPGRRLRRRREPLVELRPVASRHTAVSTPLLALHGQEGALLAAARMDRARRRRVPR